MMTRLLAVRPHTTHDSKGEVIPHPEGSTYELDDPGVVETLIALGFARRAEPDELAPASAPVAAKTTKRK